MELLQNTQKQIWSDIQIGESSVSSVVKSLKRRRIEMRGEVMKLIGRMAYGDSVKDLLESAKLASDECLVVFDEKSNKYQVYHQGDLADIYESVGGD